MFERETEFPKAIASYDDEGVAAAIKWCVDHMEDDDTLTVWTSLKSNLRNCQALQSLVDRHSNVVHVTGRGGAYLRGPGPVLMAWPDMEDIGELSRNGGRYIRAMCVINWNEKELRPWVTAVDPEILGDGTPWEERTPPLHPVVVDELESLTSIINHNNTIAAGYEKDHVVNTLLALRAAGVPMDGKAMEGWVLAHGWSGKNPERLAQYVKDINSGKRPRTHYPLRPEYVADVRRRAAAVAP